MSEQASFEAHMRDLAVVGGPAFGLRLLGRFVKHMEAVAAAGADGTAPSRADAHRTAGLAGVFGFREAGEAWGVIEDREIPSADELSHALDATRRCIVIARGRLDREAPAD